MRGLPFCCWNYGIYQYQFPFSSEHEKNPTTSIYILCQWVHKHSDLRIPDFHDYCYVVGDKSAISARFGTCKIRNKNISFGKVNLCNCSDQNVEHILSMVVVQTNKQQHQYVVKHDVVARQHATGFWTYVSFVLSDNVTQAFLQCDSAIKNLMFYFYIM